MRRLYIVINCDDDLYDEYMQALGSADNGKAVIVAGPYSAYALNDPASPLAVYHGIGNLAMATNDAEVGKALHSWMTTMDEYDIPRCCEDLRNSEFAQLLDQCAYLKHLNSSVSATFPADGDESPTTMDETLDDQDIAQGGPLKVLQDEAELLDAMPLPGMPE